MRNIHKQNYTEIEMIEIRKNRFWFKLSLLLTAFVICLCVGMGLVSSATCNGTGNVINSTTISNGCSLNNAGTYNMQGGSLNINSSANGAINFVASNIILNCNNTLIYGNSSFATGYSGVNVVGRNGITLINCNFSNYQTGFLLRRVNGYNIINVTGINNFINLYSDNTTNGNYTNINSYNSISTTDAGFSMYTLSENITINNFNSLNESNDAFLTIRPNNLILNNSIITNITRNGVYVSTNGNNIYFNNITVTNSNVSFNFFNITNANFNSLNSILSRVTTDGSFVVYSGNNNITVNKYFATNSQSHGLAIKDANNVIVSNSIINSSIKYGIDIYGICNNVTIINNTISNSLDGVVFSFASNGQGYNLQSINNTIYNITNYGVYFNGVTNGISSGDNVNLAGLRSFSTSTNVNNVTFVNGIISNSIFYTFLSSVNITNINLINININQTNSSLLISDTTNLTLNSFYDHYFFFPTISSNFTINYSNNNYWLYASNSFTTRIYNLSSALIYFSNNSVACSDISTCDGNINITLSPGNYSYIFDNANLTEGVSRTNFPITLTASELTNSKTYSIASTITTSLTNFPTYLNVDCDRVGTVTITPKNGASYSASYTCSDDTLAITNMNINYSTSSNVILVSYNQAIQTSCSQTEQYIITAIPIVGLILVILFIACVVGLLASQMGYLPDAEFGDGISLSSVLTGVLIVSTVALLMIFLVYMFESGLCPAFGG